MGYIEVDGRTRWVSDIRDVPEPTDPDTMPALIDLTLGELRARPGNAIRELASGAVVRLRDDRQAVGHRFVGYLTFSREVPPRLSPFEDLIPPTPGDETP